MAERPPSPPRPNDGSDSPRDGAGRSRADSDLTSIPWTEYTLASDPSDRPTSVDTGRADSDLTSIPWTEYTLASDPSDRPTSVDTGHGTDRTRYQGHISSSPGRASSPSEATSASVDVAGASECSGPTMEGFATSVTMTASEITPVHERRYLTMSNARKLGDKSTSMTVGPRGPILLQDVPLLDELSKFNRERIPERVVHAKGTGAHGHFHLTHTEMISKYCKARVFNEVEAQMCKVFVRFSTVGGEKGSADTVRDPRGFAVKFYTRDGNLDMVCNNTPVFFIRDPFQFPSMVHSQKRDTQTGLRDPSAYWDFLSLRHETLHQVLILHSDRGIPDGVRHMHGYTGHAFKTVNAKGRAFFMKFHFKSLQGIKNLTPAVALELAGREPDYAARDLYGAISSGNMPMWQLCFQVMTVKQAQECPFNPFDVTKVWPQADYPLHPIGHIKLTAIPRDHFSTVECAAFSPGNLVPGIEPSPDRMLQARLFAYPDAQRYRLGVNYFMKPVNAPYAALHNPTYRDGACIHDQNWVGRPNYLPNYKTHPMIERCVWAIEHSEVVTGEVGRHDSMLDDNYTQARVFYTRVLNQEQRAHLLDNLVAALSKTEKVVAARMVLALSHIDQTMSWHLLLRLFDHELLMRFLPPALAIGPWPVDPDAPLEPERDIPPEVIQELFNRIQAAFAESRVAAGASQGPVPDPVPMDVPGEDMDDFIAARRAERNRHRAEAARLAPPANPRSGRSAAARPPYRPAQR